MKPFCVKCHDARTIGRAVPGSTLKLGEFKAHPCECTLPINYNVILPRHGVKTFSTLEEMAAYDAPA